LHQGRASPQQRGLLDQMRDERGIDGDVHRLSSGRLQSVPLLILKARLADVKGSGLLRLDGERGGVLLDNRRLITTAGKWCDS
jgi:hypothetical protein